MRQATLFANADPKLSMQYLTTPEGALGFPSQRDLEGPLLTVLEAHGRCLTRDAYRELADHFRLSTEQRAATDPAGEFRLWDRHVRWTKQKLDLVGLAKSARPGVWTITDRGRDYLHNAQPGVVRLAFETPLGLAVLGNALEAMAYLHKGQVNLVLTSPPYLTRKAYGDWRDQDAYLEEFVPVLGAAKDLLADTGSLIVNLGLQYDPGQPTISLYHHDLLLRLVRQYGLFLVGEHSWLNPAKMPAPAGYVNVERIRCKASAEPVYWLAKRPRPKADNRRVLVPYSEAQLKVIERGETRREIRPSGHSAGAFAADNGGAIPGNVLVAANTASNDRYQVLCRQAGLPVHPARFPEVLPEFWIKFTTDVGDLVADLFAGSLTTGRAAETLGRRWIGIDRSATYLAGGALRFLDDTPLQVYEPITSLLRNVMGGDCA